LKPKKKYLESVIVTFIILAMVVGANGIAVSQSSGDVSVTRLVNGSSTDTAQYLPGDIFTVQLSYEVTGTQYAVSIEETLPTGWSIVDSNTDYSHDLLTNTCTWNVSSLLSGVSSGTILYLVKIPDGASYSPPSYPISGHSEWYSSLADVTDGDVSGSALTATSNILVADSEGNGPCIWISDPTEEIGDGDGHLENGEWATYRFFVNDSDGIQSYDLYVNGQPCDNITGLDEQSTYVAGTAHAQVTRRPDANDLENTFSIEATDNGGIGNEFSLPVYVPNYDYTAWAKGEWNGWSTQAAGFEPLSSSTDGGWTVLSGGNPLNLPALETHYSGPQTINKAKLTAISDIPYMGWLGIGGLTGDAGATVNVTPRMDVQVPLTTYPVYSEYNGADVASAMFYGTPEMNGGQEFHIVLVNASGIMNSIGPEDIAGAIDSVDKCTDANGDIPITSADLPGLSGLKEGYYALLVLDYRLPNTPCLVSMAPIMVTKSGMTADKIDPVLPMPGDPITYTLDMASTTPGQEYMYLMAMVPEKDYKAALNITSDGTVSGTELEFNGLTVNEHITVNPATKTVTIVGINGTYTLDSSTIHSITGLQNMFMQEFSAANVSIVNSSLTTSGTVGLTLPTKATMPVGKYIVLSLALENATGRIAAINQTTADLGTTYDIPLYKGWNLVSLPLKPVNTSLFAVVTPDLMANVTVIWEYNSSNVSSEWRYYTTLGDPYIQGNLSEINEKLGYWFLVENNTTLHVTGTIPDTSDVTLNHDWNLVGNPTLDVRNVRDVYTTSFVVWEYTGMTDTWDYWCSDADNPSSIYIQGTLTTVKPTHGYWVLIS